VNIALADEVGLIPRSTLLLYEAIEYEPSIPGSNLQFADIRRMLRDEAGHAAAADGVFGNAQQPVMVLPNLYFFARAAADLSYLDTPDEEVLGDLADLLGGPRELLVPAWRCLELPLDRLPRRPPRPAAERHALGGSGPVHPGRSAAVSRHSRGRGGEPPRVSRGDREARRGQCRVQATKPPPASPPPRGPSWAGGRCTAT
jgi:hypothetical protein